MGGMRGRKRSAFLGHGEPFVKGRYALAEAMRRAGVGPDKPVLLPAFHCRDMVEPALYLGAEALFYPVTEDLNPDFQILANMLKSGVSPAAMVLTHYFGFPNALTETEQFCSKLGIALIEDCAHALYGEEGGRLLGSVGSYATASLWKFLPVRDGAILLDNAQVSPPRKMVSRSAVAELKAAVNLADAWLNRARRKGELPILDAGGIATEAGRMAARRVPKTANAGLCDFLPALAATRSFRSSRWLAGLADHCHVISHRRENYMKWLWGVHGVMGARPLYPDLPEGVVPYAFPLLVAEPEGAFNCLKLAGVPFWRWEDMVVTDCSVSKDYRLRLLQLPCHQELRVEELKWMIAAVRRLLPGSDA